MHLKYIASTGLLATVIASPTDTLKLRQQANNLFISIPQEWTYKLPPNFSGNILTDFVQTNTSNSTIDSTLIRARSAPFISYSDEFLSLIGGTQRFNLVVPQDNRFAFEAGVWVPELDQVWFTSSIYSGYSYLSFLNLNTSTITTPNTSIPIPNPNGGYYFNGLVYVTAIGNETLAGGIYSINPVPDASGMYQTEVVVNSYFGARLNSPNDVTWGSFTSSNGTKRGVMFFSDSNYRTTVNDYTIPAGLPNTVWRFDPSEQLLQPVIPRADILNPNGVRVNKDSSLLYVGDASPTVESRPVGAGQLSSGSPAIYQYELTSDGYPTNKKLIGFARTGIADGLHIDDQGRIWTGESEGIVVRSPNGRVLGVFNAEYFLGGDAQGDAEYKIANFALAGDTLVILALQRLWTIKFAEGLIDPSRYQL
jgi:gluconolactonase